MALVFLVVAGTNNVVSYAGAGLPTWVADHGSFITHMDDSDSMVRDLLKNVSSHTFDQVMGSQPYITGYYDGTQVLVTLRNSPSPAPTSAVFSFFGTAYTQPITNGQASFPITIHPCVADQRATVSVQITGFPYIYIEAGGAQSSIANQAYRDSSGVMNVVPQNNEDLAMYWQNSAFDQVWSEADIATITGLTLQVLFGKVLQSLTNPTYTPITLTADEQNALSDVISNLIPNVSSPLSVVAPVGKSMDIHYASYRYHLQKAKMAMDSYVNDKLKITQYTSLK